MWLRDEKYRQADVLLLSMVDQTYYLPLVIVQLQLAILPVCQDLALSSGLGTRPAKIACTVTIFAVRCVLLYDLHLSVIHVEHARYPSYYARSHNIYIHRFRFVVYSGLNQARPILCDVHSSLHNCKLST